MAAKAQKLAERNAKSAREQTLLAQQRLQLAERSAYNLQLRRVQDLWRQEPGEALSLLEDNSLCPDHLREFTWELLSERVHRDGRLLRGHHGPVRAIAFLPDERRFVSGGFDGAVRIWDLKSGRVLSTMYDKTRTGISALAVSPDGELVAVCHGETVCIWSLETEQVERSISTNAGIAASIAFAPDGQTIAVGYDAGLAKIWNVSDGRIVHTFSTHAATVHELAFSPDGSLLATASHDKTVRLWDTKTGRGRMAFISHEACVRCVAFSPDGLTLATGSEDRTVRISDVSTCYPKQIFPLNDCVAVLAFSHDGSTLVAVDQSRRITLKDITGTRPDRAVRPSHRKQVWAIVVRAGSITLWDLEAGQQVRHLDYEGELVYVLKYSRDGTMLASGASDGQIRLWDPATFEPILTIDGHALSVHGLEFSPDGRTLASAGHDGVSKLWDPVTGHLRATLGGHLACVRDVALSPDGKTLYSGSEDRTVGVWGNSPSSLRETQPSIPSYTLAGHAGAVSAVAFDPNGRLLASAGELDKSIRIWDFETREAIATLEGHQLAPRYVGFTRSGQLLSSGADTTIRVWDIETRQQKMLLQGHSRYVSTFDVSADGKWLVSGAEDKQGGGELFIWDLKSGELRAELRHTKSGLISTLLGAKAEEIWSVAISPDGSLLATGGGKPGRGELLLWNMADRSVQSTLEGHEDRVRWVAFSPDGRRLASGDRRGRVRIADVKSGKELASFAAHGDIDFCVRFSPDGRMLATCGNDWLVRVWDAVTFESVAELEGHTRGVRSLDFSPDGQWLVSGSEDQTLRVWDLSSVRDSFGGTEQTGARGEELKVDNEQ